MHEKLFKGENKQICEVEEILIFIQVVLCAFVKLFYMCVDWNTHLGEPQILHKSLCTCVKVHTHTYTIHLTIFRLIWLHAFCIMSIFTFVH